MRLSLLKIVGVTLFIIWFFIAYSVLKVGSYLPANTAPIAGQDKGAYYEGLYYNTLYDGSDTNSSSEDDQHTKVTSRAESITQKAEKELEKDFLDVISTYLENVNYYRGELRKSNPLMKFGFYKPFEDKYFEFYHNGKNKYKKAHLSLMNEPCYCEIVDFYNIYHPENVLNDKFFFTDYKPDSFMRKSIINVIGKDEMPSIHIGMPKSESSQRKSFMSKRTNMFFTKSDNFHYYHEIGKNFLGFSQMYNHIPGNGALRRLDTYNQLLRDYDKSMQLEPKCLNITEDFVKTYKLSNKLQCHEFFNALKKYDEKTISYLWLVHNYDPYSSKMNRSRATIAWKNGIMAEFNNGDKCTENKTNKLIVQEPFRKPLKNSTHLIMLRQYVLIASTNPLRVFLHEGHFSSVSFETFFKAEFPDKVEDASKVNEQIKSGDIIVDSEDNFQEYLDAITNGTSGSAVDNAMLDEEESITEVITDTSAEDEEIAGHGRRKMKIETFLVPYFNETGARDRIKEKINKQSTMSIIHMLKMAQPHLYKGSGVFELFAVDFYLDDRIHPRLLSFESTPTFHSNDDPEFVTKFKNLLFDMFDIEFSYLRSRMTRLQKLLTQYHSDVVSRTYKNTTSYEKKLEEINVNTVEPGFEVQLKSNFKKIIDLSPGSTLTFESHIDKACLNLADKARSKSI